MPVTPVYISFISPEENYDVHSEHKLNCRRKTEKKFNLEKLKKGTKLFLFLIEGQTKSRFTFFFSPQKIFFCLFPRQKWRQNNRATSVLCVDCWSQVHVRQKNRLSLNFKTEVRNTKNVQMNSSSSVTLQVQIDFYGFSLTPAPYFHQQSERQELSATPLVCLEYSISVHQIWFLHHFLFSCCFQRVGNGNRIKSGLRVPSHQKCILHNGPFHKCRKITPLPWVSSLPLFLFLASSLLPML